MRGLPQGVYEKLVSEIQNAEVPGLLMSALLKQDVFVRDIANTLDEKAKSKAILFTLFAQQFNTIISLSQKTSCVVDENISFLDITSIFTLVRSCHERYLSFWHLNTALCVWDVTPEQELNFRWLCFKHGGLVDEQRSFEMTARLRDLTNMSKTLESFKAERRKLFDDIRAHSIFAALDQRSREDIERYGNWRIGPRGSMSWRELVQLSPLYNRLGQYEYFQLNQHAHTCYRGLSLVNKFHDDINNGLVD
ncbi:MAG: hypothetical protein VYD90_06655 [Pseudomonadota bacterium]|nr:hypothetical protein [Pseudomonadota bacterium]